VKRSAALAVVSLALLAGCASVGEIGPRPEIRLPDNYVFAPSPDDAVPASADALLPRNELAFLALMDYATNAPDLAIALARVDAARAVADRAKAERLPSIDGSASAGATRSNPNQFGNLPAGAAVDSTRFSISGDISARWDLDLFGRLRASQRSAKARLQAANFEAQAVRIAIVSEVAAAVVDWQNVQAQQEVLASNIASAEDRAGLIRSRVKAGLNPGLDAMRAEAVVEGLRAQLPLLKGDEAQIIARMVALTALPAQDVQQAFAQSTGQWSGGASPAELPSALIAARPDIQAAAARLVASDADLAATAASRFPRFTLSSALGLLAFSLGGLFDSDAITGQLGAGISGPLLDFGRIEAEIAQGKAQTRMAFEELRKATFMALGEAEGSFAALAAADREADLLAAQATRESDVARVSASRQRAGLESMIAVLDADRTAYQSRQLAVAAKGRAQRVRLTLWQSLGAPGLEAISEARNP
jgi:outer membrane protein, multidrug efflux system